jgi:cell wall-associated NlpC family hydrolase
MINAKSKKLLLFLYCMLFISCNVNIEDAINNAESYIGVPYKYGGEDRMGIDCSALVQICYNSAGFDLPRRAVWQSEKGEEIEIDNLKRGDLIFFKKKNNYEIDHVGIIIEANGLNSKFIHSSKSLKGVTYSYLNENHWFDMFQFAKRIN